MKGFARLLGTIGAIADIAANKVTEKLEKFAQQAPSKFNQFKQQVKQEYFKAKQIIEKGGAK